MYKEKEIRTYAETGEISSPFFDENFNLDNYALNEEYHVSLANPCFNDPANITLKFKYDIEDEHSYEYIGLILEGVIYLNQSRKEVLIKKNNFNKEHTFTSLKEK